MRQVQKPPAIGFRKRPQEVLSFQDLQLQELWTHRSTTESHGRPSCFEVGIDVLIIAVHYWKLISYFLIKYFLQVYQFKRNLSKISIHISSF